MKNLLRVMCLGLGLCVVCSCSDDGPTLVQSTLIGKWLLVETKISVGGPAIHTPVQPIPQQILIFNADSMMFSTVKNFSNGKSYSIKQDQTNHMKFLAIYDSIHHSTSLAYAEQLNFFLNHSGDTLELSSRWCFEECGSVYKRIQ